MRLTLWFYTDKAGDHRWRLTHRNGHVIGAATEGYRRAIDARANAQLVTRYRYRPGIKVVTGP